VLGSHTYQDESFPAPSFVLTVHLTDGTVTADASSLVHVGEAPLPPGTVGVTKGHPHGTHDQRFIQELSTDLFNMRMTAFVLNWFNGLLHPLPHSHKPPLSRAQLVQTMLTPFSLRLLHTRAVHAGLGFSQSAIINGYYKMFLDRAVTPIELHGNLQRFRRPGGEAAIIVGILSSSEYYRKSL
jgi:hypothetical protein